MTRARKAEYNLNINGKNMLMDSRRFELLKKIDNCGSIMNASKKTKIPYRTALKYIEVMEETLGHGVVFTTRGGRGGGGGSKLSSLGKEIVKEYTKVEKVLQKVSQTNELSGKISIIDEEGKVMHIDFNGEDITLPMTPDFKLGEDVILLISPEDIIVMLEPQESSVRNIIEGKIVGLKLHDDMVRLEIQLSNKETLDVDVTEFSREKLELDLGKIVFIGFKAVSLAVVKG
ncbi:MAG: transcriptional regulator [Methanobacteriales archaeon HGW-Methanobacteriales-1]|jgi:molybdate transport system regulatory protein|nr:MAG: transcriptional regulator [Methanobacteriales archaeon HGW-Methanobacteriales-1]